MSRYAEMIREDTAPSVNHQTLAAWRSALVTLRDEERHLLLGVPRVTSAALRGFGCLSAATSGALGQGEEIHGRRDEGATRPHGHVPAGEHARGSSRRSSLSPG